MVACRVSFVQFLERSQERIVRLALEHLVLVLEAIAIGTVLGVVLGVLVARRPAARAVVLASTGLILTVPSLALFALLLALHRAASARAGRACALVLYSLLPIVRNTVTGPAAVDPAVVESARASAWGRWRRLLQHRAAARLAGGAHRRAGLGGAARRHRGARPDRQRPGARRADLRRAARHQQPERGRTSPSTARSASWSSPCSSTLLFLLLAPADDLRGDSDDRTWRR